MERLHHSYSYIVGGSQAFSLLCVETTQPYYCIQAESSSLQQMSVVPCLGS